MGYKSMQCYYTTKPGVERTKIVVTITIEVALDANKRVTGVELTCR